jgi:hypothetical protein
MNERALAFIESARQEVATAGIASPASKPESDSTLIKFFSLVREAKHGVNGEQPQEYVIVSAMDLLGQDRSEWKKVNTAYRLLRFPGDKANVEKAFQTGAIALTLVRNAAAK